MNSENKILNLKKAELRSEINELQSALNNSYKNMQLAEEPDLLDYYAYKIKSQESLHNYLLGIMKKLD